MAYSPFRYKVMFRIIVITISIFLFFFFLLYQKYYLASSVMFFFTVVQVYLLFRYFDHTNRELSRFFDSVKFADFSQNFLTKDTDDSFKELKSSLKNVINQFRQARSEKEEQFQYLQTIVKHIGTGLISFNQKGNVELINNTALQMLGVNDLKNIHNIPSAHFANRLINIKSGDRELIRLSIDGTDQHLSMSAVDFKMHGEKFTLVSLQDITSELERERMANEFEIAYKVQTRLLPKADPEIKGFTISAGCYPAKEVGGDYYDFINLSGEKTGIIIGDVAGKGMPAAFYMTLTKGIFQSCAEKSGSPKDVLIRINEIICKSIVKGSFVTLLYAVLDPANNTVKFARAGHEPLLVFNSTEKRIYEYKPQGMGVGLDCGGLFRDSIEESEVILKKNDLIFFYTDGLIDLRNRNNNEFGQRRLKEHIINNSHLSPFALTTSLMEEAKNYRGDYMQYDDLTLITVKADS